MAVDYLVRFLSGIPVEATFAIAIKGYAIKSLLHSSSIKAKDNVFSLIKKVKKLDDKSIIAVCQITAYDVWARNPFDALTYGKQPSEIKPDSNTIANIRIMVSRTMNVIKSYGGITSEGFTFLNSDKDGNILKSGYTSVVASGDGDFLTADTMWELKVTKRPPTSKHTLQLLMYWIMGLHSEKPEFTCLKRIGFIVPRLNKVYILDTRSISPDVIHQVEKEVICYE